MKKRYIWIIVIAIIVIAFFTFGKKLIFKPAKTQYRTAEITEGEIRETVTATGTLGAVEMVNVGTQVSGTISKINVDFNSKVKKGQVIAVIDPTPLKIQVALAETNLLKAQYAAKLAKLQMDPILELKKEDMVSQSDVDNVTTAYQVAAASVKTSQAQVDLAKTSLQNATILAPISGVVISRAVDPGQTVAASFNTPTLFSIAKDLTQMQVIASVDEADIGKVKNDQTVTFNVDAFPDREYEGQVTQIRMQPSTDNNVVTYNVVISAPNPDQSLLPGMTANLTILVAMKSNILKAPVAALQFKPAKNKGASSDSSMGTRNQSQSATASAANPSQGQRTAGMGQGQSTAGGAGRGQGRGRGFGGRSRMGMKPVGGMEPGKVYVLVNDTPQLVRVMTGISDGTFTEVQGKLKAGDQVIIGIQPVKQKGSNGSAQAPGFGGGGGGGPRGR